MKVSIDELINAVRHYRPACDSAGIRKAYDFALNAHQGQLRKSGEPFIIHPLNIAYSLTEYFADDDSIIAALLHDVVEDTEISCPEIEKSFGREVAALVDGVTKVRKEFKRYASSKRKADTLRKFISTVVKDQRVLLIKLLDRRHNMRTISHLPQVKQVKIAKETLYYYVPLAKSISLWEIKTELENLCFSILKPSSYFRHEKVVRALAAANKHYFDAITAKLHDSLKRAGINGQAKTVILTPYEIQELKRKGADVRKHFFKIILTTDSEKDCYLALGMIHKQWKPVLKFFKDFIALPKQNSYQALHTTVIGGNGDLIMIVIQTRDMYRYSMMSAPYDNDYASNLKASLSHIDLRENSENYLNCVKNEALCEHVHCFDDDGNTYRLPKGASLIDFFHYLKEYKPGMPVKRVVAAVNGKKSPLRRIIRDDDVISFAEGSNGPAVHPLLLRYAKTSRAKCAIRNSLKKISTSDAVRYGQKILRGEFSRAGLPSIDKETLLNLSKKLNFSSLNDFFEQTGRGGTDISRVLPMMCSRLPDIKDLPRKRVMTVVVTNNRNRVGFVKNVLATFQKLNISISEIKGYSPRHQRHGIVEIKIREALTPKSFREVILPLCNTLEQVESVDSVKLKLT
jgi:guanosine-3',5'-bis(diphosphate) 3'-pyrophosphohydrolase